MSHLSSKTQSCTVEQQEMDEKEQQFDPEVDQDIHVVLRILQFTMSTRVLLLARGSVF